MRWALIDPTRDVATQLPGWERTELVGGGFEVWENPAWVGDAIGQLADGSEIALELDRRSPTELAVTVTDPSPMRVIVHHQTAPGMDGARRRTSADIVDADGFFLAVDVPAGTRTVDFSYEPRWLTPSLVACGCWVCGHRARSSSPIGSDPATSSRTRYSADGVDE